MVKHESTAQFSREILYLFFAKILLKLEISKKFYFQKCLEIPDYSSWLSYTGGREHLATLNENGQKDS